MRNTGKRLPTLHLPEEISGIVRGGAFPADPHNPLVCFEFTDGSESLFDTRKGLFLNPPAGVSLPPRESLKALGLLISGFRSGLGNSGTVVRESSAQGPAIRDFEVCC